MRSLGSPLFTLAVQNKITDLQHLLFLFMAGDMAIMDANSEVWGQVSTSFPLQVLGARASFVRSRKLLPVRVICIAHIS